MYDSSHLQEIDPHVYLKTMVAVAVADGQVHEREQSYINAQAQLLAVNPEPYWVSPDPTLSFLNTQNLSYTTRISILRDCLVLAYIDGVCDEQEREKVVNIASILHITESKVAELETWLKDLWTVLERGNQLLKGE